MVLYNSEEINMGDVPTINTPMLWINKYLQEKIAKNIKIAVPFFPVRPSALEDIESLSLQLDGTRYPYSGVMAIYDRMLKRRKMAFPHIKCEQLVYYFYSTQENVTESMIASTEVLYRLLDNEDESAEDINYWATDKSIVLNNTTLYNEFYFHNFKVYQLEESRDQEAFGTIRTFSVSKFIVEYDYHRMP